MKRIRDTLKRNWLILPIVLAIVSLVGLVTYFSGTLGVSGTRTAVVVTPLDITAVPPLPGTPVSRFSRVDSSVETVLDSAQNGYEAAALDMIGENIRPVGAYLPQTGNMQFELVAPTALPTPLPYATSPPLPLPAVPEQILPTVAAETEDGESRLLPFGGESCAPAGLPVDGILTQRFHAYHSGADFGVPLGTPVLATHSGQVTFAGWSEVGYGYLVIIQNGPFITYYAHNMSFNVSVNQLVGKGSVIAWSGSTGNSTGPHVHYETRINDVPVDPLTFEDRGYPTC